MPTLRPLWSLAPLALSIGCGGRADPTPAPAPATISSDQAPSGPGASPGRRPAPAAERASFDAVVLERVDAGPYGYLRVRRDGAAQTIWVVTPFVAINAGTRVHVDSFARARDFASRRLKRRFDDLYFAAVHSA
jgi:hypothetical protein